jgi:hypothetical protein
MTYDVTGSSVKPPVSKWLLGRSASSGTASRRLGIRRTSVARTLWSSIRASGAPMQYRDPWPKVRCGLSVRRISNSAGRSNAAQSTFASCSASRMTVLIQCAVTRWVQSCSSGLLKTGEMPFDHVFGKPFFDYLAEHEDVGHVFDAALSAFNRRQHEAVFATYDFGPFRRIVDVGGGAGGLLAAICARYPAIESVVFDLPSTRQAAEQTFRSVGG